MRGYIFVIRKTVESNYWSDKEDSWREKIGVIGETRGERMLE